MLNNKMKLKPLATLLSMGAISLFLSGCNQANSEETAPIVKPVKLMQVPDNAQHQYDSFIAKIDATERAGLSFQVAGEIEHIFVKMGSQVSKGQTLAKLDPTDYQLALDAKQAEFDLANTAYQRAKTLFGKKLISTDDFDQRETEYKAAKSSLEQAKTDLTYTQIIAPFDGVISLSFSEEHQVVGANQPVLNLINNKIMDVVFTIPVTYVESHGLERISNSALSVTMDSHKQIQIPATFKEISTKPDTDTNSYRAAVTIERPEHLNLLSGMTGQVNLQKRDYTKGVMLSDSAWVSRDGETGTVYRFDEQTQIINAVTVGIDDNGHVTYGLNPGDWVVEAGVEKLVSGQQVKAWAKEGGI
ncbi:efflux RND transporter periplasmic adaptor subunit [Vibrio sp. LaRot3]|uniref:efflux RND transporter periplasmic adaptor subunit n=1 Tax=Vibrio sp. LaRot3 TaxID=2998829 RepID=UPI0022CDDF97|nr:efflux RND transporter periplasmic adaptor subunit [Vibrio sp. LaRot3]MDA0148413.1 efflux RND transporter periplasmic adaptor subunit [Vibrio sp. LaRot3]